MFTWIRNAITKFIVNTVVKDLGANGPMRLAIEKLLPSQAPDALRVGPLIKKHSNLCGVVDFANLFGIANGDKDSFFFFLKFDMRQFNFHCLFSP